MKQTQQKGKNQYEMTTVKSSRVNPFGNNTSASDIYAQAEKIILATHMVTNFIPDQDTLKDKLRSKSQDLLDYAMELRTGFKSVDGQKINKMIAQIRVIETLLDIAHATGLISKMNLQVLKTAYTNFAHTLVKNEDDDQSESLTLMHEYFETKNQKSFQQEQDGQTNILKDKEISKGHFNKMSDRNTQETDVEFEKFDGSQESLVKKIKPKRTRRKSDKSIATTNARQQIILNFIRKNKRATNKDFVTLFNGVSAKTIQRELQNLIKKELLKKEGERRWSVYTLV